jgi:hypothetical protein
MPSPNSIRIWQHHLTCSDLARQRFPHYPVVKRQRAFAENLLEGKRHFVDGGCLELPAGVALALWKPIGDDVVAAFPDRRESSACHCRSAGH